MGKKNLTITTIPPHHYHHYYHRYHYHLHHNHYHHPFPSVSQVAAVRIVIHTSFEYRRSTSWRRECGVCSGHLSKWRRNSLYCYTSIHHLVGKITNIYCPIGKVLVQRQPSQRKLLSSSGRFPSPLENSKKHSLLQKILTGDGTPLVLPCWREGPV